MLLQQHGWKSSKLSTCSNKSKFHRMLSRVMHKKKTRKYREKYFPRIDTVRTRRRRRKERQDKFRGAVRWTNYTMRIKKEKRRRNDSIVILNSTFLERISFVVLCSLQISSTGRENTPRRPPIRSCNPRAKQRDNVTIIRIANIIGSRHARPRNTVKIIARKSTRRRCNAVTLVYFRKLGGSYDCVPTNALTIHLNALYIFA